MASSREDNLATTQKVREKIEKLYFQVEKGFGDQKARAENIKRNWKIYRCETDANMLFTGRNQLYAPLIYDAVRARATRFANQLFPQNGKHVECASSDGTIPRAAIAVVEHHIDHARLRELIPALCIAGDVEGQYNVYVGWQDGKRYTTRRVTKKVEADGIPVGDADDTEEEEESVGGPYVELISDADICVLPATAATLDDAIHQGGSVTILRRWNKAKIKTAIKDKVISKAAGDRLIDNLDQKQDGQYHDADKDAAKAVGVKKDGRGDWAAVFETWTMLEVDGKHKLCQIFMTGAGDEEILSAKRNPLWCDKLPILSTPVQRQPGTMKGQAPIDAVADIQYYANDVLNETADATNYALLPILMRDPECTAPLVLSPGAIWDVAPSMVEPLAMPPMWHQGIEIIGDLQNKIMQTLSVSPAMLTQGPSNKAKKNQAEIAQQQQVEILTTADAVITLEQGIMTPLVGLFLDLDYQYRDTKMMARQYGALGSQAIMEEVPPLQNDARFTVRWSGVEAARNAQQVQQKITALGVLRALPPAMYPDYTLDAQTIIVDLVESVFGPQQARLVLKDHRSELTVSPEAENKMMDEGLVVDTHIMDNDMEHLQAHKKSMDQEGDEHGLKLVHIQKHQKQAQAKVMAQKAALGGQGGASPPQGGGQPTPPGAQPRGPQGPQAPAGVIPQDQMKDPNVMPRQPG
jgi:hypothetical protein